jgi:hypothetical protein
MVAASNNDVLYIIQIVQLASMPLDSIVIAMATILMSSILISALA